MIFKSLNPEDIIIDDMEIDEDNGKISCNVHFADDFDVRDFFDIERKTWEDNKNRHIVLHVKYLPFAFRLLLEIVLSDGTYCKRIYRPSDKNYNVILSRINEYGENYKRS